MDKICKFRPLCERAVGEEGGGVYVRGGEVILKGGEGRLEAIGLRRRPQERTLLCSGKDLLP